MLHLLQCIIALQCSFCCIAMQLNSLCLQTACNHLFFWLQTNHAFESWAQREGGGGGVGGLQIAGIASLGTLVSSQVWPKVAVLTKATNLTKSQICELGGRLQIADIASSGPLVFTPPLFFFPLSIPSQLLFTCFCPLFPTVPTTPDSWQAAGLKLGHKKLLTFTC